MKGVTLELNDLGKQYLKSELEKLMRPSYFDNKILVEAIVTVSNLNIRNDINEYELSAIRSKNNRINHIEFKPEHLKFKD